MDFAIPQDLEDYYAELEGFIDSTIAPLVARDDNIRFFDHRREDARTDWDRGGLPSHDWALLRAEEIRRQGWLEPVDGSHPRPLRAARAGAAQ